MNGSILLEIERFDKLSQLKRLLAYVDAVRIIQDLSNVKVQPDYSIKRQSFWDMESDWEKRLYNKMKSCEARHPILGIIICTILGGHINKFDSRYYSGSVYYGNMTGDRNFYSVL